MMGTEKIGWYWHRLRAMDGAEIAGRIVEKTRVLQDQRALSELAEFALGLPRTGSARWLPERDTAPEALRTAVAAKAQALRSGRWCLYGWKEVTMPDPPSWGWDALHAGQATLETPVAQLDHRQLPGGVDARSVWEINRWSELVRLAQNAWLNEEVDDARLVQRWLNDWAECNRVGQGINWTSPLEAALRLLHFTWIDVLLRTSAEADVRAEQEHLAARLVPSHAWWVWRHRSMGSSANNHLLGELAALTVAAQRWPGLMHLTCCAETAWSKLQEETLHQFASDGGNKEQALHYHLFAWSLIWQARRVMGAGSAEFEDRLAHAATFFNALSQPEEPWDWGDSDDAELTPFTLDRCRELAEWQDWFTGRHAALSFWLGAPPVTLPPPSPPAIWQAFPHSGWLVKRHPTWMARFDASPLGFGKLAAHGHLDALHVSLWQSDRAVVVDPGTGAYHSDAAWRAQLASWEAHNGPVPMAGRATPKRAGVFLWSQHHEPPKWQVTDETAIASLACDGPLVTRAVRLDDAGLEVTDRISTDLPHQVTWTFAPEWEVHATPRAQRWLLTQADGSVLQLQLESSQPMEVLVSQVIVSPRFLQRREAMALRVRFTGDLRTRVTPSPLPTAAPAA